MRLEYEYEKIRLQYELVKNNTQVAPLAVVLKYETPVTGFGVDIDYESQHSSNVDTAICAGC